MGVVEVVDNVVDVVLVVVFAASDDVNVVVAFRLNDEVEMEEEVGVELEVDVVGKGSAIKLVRVSQKS